MKRTKKIMSLILSVVMLMAFSTSVLAAEPEVLPDDREYLVVNGTDIVRVGEDYENPETGEYVRWDKDARGVDKTFSFKIRYSISSSKFTVHSSKVSVKANAHIEDLKGNTVSGYKGHKYTVSIVGVYARNLQFAVQGKQSGTVSGLKKNGSYKVTITNNDYLDATKNLVGSGSVSTL